MKISLIGLPGSGKSTLAQLLGGMFGVPHVSSGALARSTGFAGSIAERQGQLDPDESKIRLLVKQAIQDKDTYILDGFPRMIDQIEAVDIPLDAVLWLKLKSPLIGTERLIDRGRPDDTLQVIEMRISTYFRYTYPLVEYFQKQKKLITINASGTISDTLAQAVIQLSHIGDEQVNNYLHRLLKRDVEGTKRSKR